MLSRRRIERRPSLVSVICAAIIVYTRGRGVVTTLGLPFTPVVPSLPHSPMTFDP